MKYATIATLLSVVLSGCATPEQRAERQIQVLGPYCDKLGFQRDTDGWRNCVQTQANQRGAAVQRSMTCTTLGSTTTCN